MSKDTDRGHVKPHAFDSKNKHKNDSVIDTITDGTANSVAFIIENKLDSDGYYKRLNKLRRAIGSGRFTINPTRVAEKLIQFETQLTL